MSNPDSFAQHLTPLGEFFERSFQQSLKFHPQEMTSLGLVDQKDQLDDLSEETAIKINTMHLQQLEELKSFKNRNDENPRTQRDRQKSLRC